MEKSKNRTALLRKLIPDGETLSNHVLDEICKTRDLIEDEQITNWVRSNKSKRCSGKLLDDLLEGKFRMPLFEFDPGSLWVHNFRAANVVE